MALRLGISDDLEVTKWELEQQFKNTREWKSTTAFENRAEAEEWVEQKCKEFKCKSVKPKKPKKHSRGWYGFSFEHDGPK